MRYLAPILVSFLLATPAISVDLFRYRGAARDGRTLEYVFEIDESNVPKTVAKEKTAEIAADFMTTFYHVQIGALETQEPAVQDGLIDVCLSNRGQEMQGFRGQILQAEVTSSQPSANGHPRMKTKSKYVYCHL